VTEPLSTTQLVYTAVGLFVFAYLLGGIPWSLLVGKWVKGVDLRTIGSGNLGATNVARSLGGTWAVIVFFLDFAKGAIPPTLVYFFAPAANQDLLMIVGAAGAIVGHVYSPYIKFRGGKGIAVTAGAAAVVLPWCLLFGTVLFFSVALSTRRVSAGSVAIAATFPITAWFFYPDRPVAFAFSIAACILVLWSHRANIVRLVKGEEPKVTWGIFKND
jgi:acyl phosphate:glycerol-3-phosphate acyltransferase